MFDFIKLYEIKVYLIWAKVCISYYYKSYSVLL